MKKVLVCAVLLIPASAAAAPMSRVIEIRDSRTVVVETEGVTAIVALRDVSIAAEDEPAASAWLRRTLANAWVYVENGDVYRSPDGLYVNAAMKRRAWLGMTYLGQLDLGLPSKGQSSSGKVAESKKPPAPRKAKTSSPQRVKRRSGTRSHKP